MDQQTIERESLNDVNLFSPSGTEGACRPKNLLNARGIDDRFEHVRLQ
jgi:hypothetical protein